MTLITSRASCDAKKKDNLPIAKQKLYIGDWLTWLPKEDSRDASASKKRSCIYLSFPVFQFVPRETDIQSSCNMIDPEDFEDNFRNYSHQYFSPLTDSADKSRWSQIWSSVTKYSHLQYWLIFVAPIHYPSFQTWFEFDGGNAKAKALQQGLEIRPHQDFPNHHQWGGPAPYSCASWAFLSCLRTTGCVRRITSRCWSTPSSGLETSLAASCGVSPQTSRLTKANIAWHGW